MSYAEFQEPPPKKRRFFVEDPVEDETLHPEPSLPDELNALPDAHYGSSDRIAGGVGNDANVITAPGATDNSGFDIELFSSIVGEQLPPSTLQRLQEQSGNDLQRGMDEQRL